MKSIHTEIQINAPANLVWETVVNLDHYAQWNSYISKITLPSKDVEVGNEFTIICKTKKYIPRSKESQEILAILPNRFTFHTGIKQSKKLFSVGRERRQICMPCGANATTYINVEEFHGVFAPLVYFFYIKKIKKIYEEQNFDLKKYVESIADH